MGFFSLFGKAFKSAGKSADKTLIHGLEEFAATSLNKGAVNTVKTKSLSTARNWAPRPNAGDQLRLFQGPQKYRIKGGLSPKPKPKLPFDAKKWIPTAVGATVIGGGLVAYLDSRKHGRSNRELYNG